MADGWDDDDDVDDEVDEDSGLSELDGLVTPWPSDHADAGPDDLVETLLFTVSNPPGSVAATALINGRIERVELTDSVSRMTESQLAEEITLVATLARQKAQAAQHAIIAHLMGELGHDSVGTSGYLRREIGLPSPDDFMAAAHSVFQSRYDDY